MVSRNLQNEKHSLYIDTYDMCKRIILYIHTHRPINEWVDGWMHAWMDACMDGCMHGWMHAWMDACMDGWMEL